MTIHITPEIKRQFAEYLKSPEFIKGEREYKWCVHLLLGTILKEPYITSGKFPELLALLMSGRLGPDDLDLSAEDAAFVRAWLKNDSSGLYGAISNLCGGRWGGTTARLDSHRCGLWARREIAASIPNITHGRGPI